MTHPHPAPFGNFEEAWPALERPHLVASPVLTMLESWPGAHPVESIMVVDTDPDKADTATFAVEYDIPLEVGANCVVVAVKRGQEITLAACVVLATTRVDVNKTVRRHFAARKASFAPMETAVAESGMEYGGITPIGLPDTWPVLIDEAVVSTPYVLIGSGKRRAKIILPGHYLAQVPHAEVISGLAS
jgi:prolyl-tRNA editing enzyme YbaK/EbsC (Cys-tRNA(Pro) deacylase)